MPGGLDLILSTAGRKALLADLAGLAYGIEADFQLMRVSRWLSPRDFTQLASTGLDPRTTHHELWAEHVDAQRAVLNGGGVWRPEVYLAVRLSPPTGAVVDELAATARSLRRGGLGELRARLGFGDPAGISERRMRELADLEQRTFARVSDFLACERATSLEVQWLIRRAFCRGLREPILDVHWRPQALVLLNGDELAYRPLEADVLRLCNSAIDIGERSLRISGERGVSHQAALAFGALPESVTFPGPGAELLFAPLEAAGFPVDACFTARWVPNDLAARTVRRKVVDADNEASEQAHGDHGPSPQAELRPHAARALEEYLTGDARPPLLRASISLTVGAGDEVELERRVERLRREYGTVRLERPFGHDQLALWRQHFPGQGTALPAYEDYLLVEQLGAMVPTATYAVGCDAGPYLGHTLSGSRQPVFWDLTQPCRSSKTPALLLVGPPGRGKTLALQRLCYEAFLQGSRVIDLDPKPDHRWTDLPEVAAHTRVIELAAHQQCAGMLDPLRIAPAADAEDLAVEWLTALLRDDVPHGWETEIRAAVKAVIARDHGRGSACCGEVLELLDAGNDDARQAGRALGVYADGGLAALGFAKPSTPARAPDGAQVTLLRIAGLTLPEPGQEAAGSRERTSQALLTLAATYALSLMASGGDRHTVLCFDEAWVLTGTTAGRRLLRRANRLGRAQNGTPLLGTQTIGDVDTELKELVGAVMAFGAETDSEARRALELLGQDPDDDAMRRRLLAMRGGRCLLRDYERRLASVQIDFTLHPKLLAAFDTTPKGHSDHERP